MPVQVIWDDEGHTTIRYIIENHWTWNEMHDAIKQSNMMLDTVNQPVDFIYDLSRSQGIPGGALTHLHGLIGREHHLSGQSAIVGQEKSFVLSFSRGILSMIERLYQPDWGLLFFDSVEEARQEFAKRRQ